ncbi:MAG: PQQ-dependent sugar dehydrogenase [Pseudomonadota bacterium]
MSLFVGAQLSAVADYLDKGLVESNQSLFQIAEIPRSSLGLTGNGGAITTIGDYLLVIGRDGEKIVLINPINGVTYKNPTSIPMNRKAHFEYAKENFSEFGFNRAVVWFRVLDAEVVYLDGTYQLLVSYHWFNDRWGCKETRIGRYLIDDSDRFFTRTEVRQESEFEVLFRAKPCLPYREMTVEREQELGYLKDVPARSNETGGNLAIQGHTLYFSLGDVGSRLADPPFAQDPRNDYGKIWSLSLSNPKDRDVIAMGVRNPQGLDFDHHGNLWESEHGPKGGDEINIITKGSNYGWPWTTKGVEYGGYSWTQTPSSLPSKMTPPVFTFSPSIAPTELLANPKLLGGQGLLMLSLAARSIFMIDIGDDNRVTQVERLALPYRLRDVAVFDPDHDFGNDLYLLSDKPDLVRLRPVDSGTSDLETLRGDRPQSEFRRVAPTLLMCAKCHSFSSAPGAVSSLHGVLGKRAGFVGATDALNSSGIVWDRATLLRYILSPQDVVPGTAMPNQDLSTEVAEQIVNYFETR